MNKKKYKNKILIIFLRISKWLGFFRLSRFLTRNGLRVLCYHSFSMADEHHWKPRVFIHPDTLEERLQIIKRGGYKVTKLGSAVERLYKKQPRTLGLVITIDDGWHATKSIGHEMFSKFGYPYTVYVTSYYCQKETPIFEMLVKYLFWKTDIKQISSKQLAGLNISGDHNRLDAMVELTDDLMAAIIRHGDINLNNQQRYALAKQLGEILGLDVDNLAEKRMLSLLTKDEIKALSNSGVDIQLHTHRHRWPMQAEPAIKELNQNREFLEPIVEKELNHFCYPNGDWHPEQVQFLKSAGVKSATTCTPGLNFPQTSRYELMRFVDGEDVDPIIFESYIAGFTELLMKAFAIVKFR